LNFLAEKPEDRAVCNVDGKEYKDGEYFNVESEPDLICVCQPGYEGKDNLWHFYVILNFLVPDTLTCINTVLI